MVAAKLFLDCIRNGSIYDNCLLRGRKYSIIKGLACNDIFDCLLDVSGSFDKDRTISCSAVDQRFVGILRRLEHPRNACIQNHGCVLMVHEFDRTAGCYCVHVAHGSFRHSRRFTCCDHDVQCSANSLLRSRVRREYNGVARLNRDQCLVDRCRYRTCCRTECCDHTHRNADIDDPLLRIIADHTYVAFAPQLLSKICADKMVLGVFVLPVTEISLISRQNR